MEGETGEQVEGEDEQVGNARNSSHISVCLSPVYLFISCYISSVDLSVCLCCDGLPEINLLKKNKNNVYLPLQ